MKFDRNAVIFCDEGTERHLDVFPVPKDFRTDWDHIIEMYKALKPGQGVLANSTLNAARRDVVNTLKRRGLAAGVDFELYPSRVDAEGNRLPSGNWLQYIKRLSDESPTL